MQIQKLVLKTPTLEMNKMSILADQLLIVDCV